MGLGQTSSDWEWSENSGTLRYNCLLLSATFEDNLLKIQFHSILLNVLKSLLKSWRVKESRDLSSGEYTAYVDSGMHHSKQCNIAIEG